jgi:tetratricopeptide (TPR) repeat protein
MRFAAVVHRVVLVVFLVLVSVSTTELVYAGSRVDILFWIGFTYLTCGIPYAIWLIVRRSWGMRSCVLCGHCLLWAMAGLVWTGRLWSTCYLCAELGLRVAVLVLWLMLGTGICLWLISFVRRSVRWHRFVPLVLKLTTSSAIVLVSLETTARIIEHRSQQRLVLPENLPPSAEGVVSLVTIGGSTMRGFPYDPHYSIGHVVRWQLQQRYPSTRVEFSSLAMTGVNLQQAVGQLSQLTSRPDIVILYSGHNEFFHGLEELVLTRKASWEFVDRWLAASAIFRVANPPIARLALSYRQPEASLDLVNLPVCPEQLAQVRLERFEANLNTLAEWGKRHGVTLVWYVPVACHADMEPNRSVMLDPPGQVQKDGFEETWRELRTLQQSGRVQEACQRYADLVSMYPEFAEWHFRKGECHRLMGEIQEAQRHFRAALDLDGYPIRATQTYREAVSRIASQHRIVVLDAESILLNQADVELLDDGLFLDGIHPNLKSIYGLGMAGVQAIMDKWSASDRHADSVSQHADIVSDSVRSSFADSIHDLHVTPEILADAYEKTHDVLERYARLRVFDKARRYSEAEDYSTLTQRIRDGQPEGMLGEDLRIRADLDAMDVLISQ